ncbi:long-chain-fatty-acid--CoA ligase [Caulobacter mirabilis]|uniref:3-methylmercaptopropionyl-CoA ligase n=1 Tax=Caulobacter mirabilis TaxID=69666 RepID=A0A2D2B1D4_9CAUL|nr:long-chain-fatty-acid--CoA ligase [Caulobacter mirabilis]ATQ44075.1 acyl-CoA synthetase [Caulobacter mirabilis]
MTDLSDIHSVADVPRVQAAIRPNAEAIWFEGRTTTFAELDRASNRCAQALLAQGLKPGDRVGVLAKNIDDFFVLWFGAVKARVTLAPVNWRLAPPEVAFILRDAGAKLLVVGQDFAGVVDMIISDLPDVRGLVQFEPGHPRWPAFRDWISQHPAEDPNLAPRPDDDVIQLYTSGTTGLPKGVQLTQANFMALFALALEAGWARYEPEKTNLVVMPLFHVAGTNCGLLALLQGVRNILTREVNPVEILARLQDQRVNYAFLAPTIINMLLLTPGVEEADFSHLERVFYGASPISETVLRQAQARFGSDFTQLYGLTETIGGATYLPPEDHAPERDKLRSAGKPWPGFEVQVITPEGKVAAPGEVGEVKIRAKGVMKGYWNRPDATVEAICSQGWFSSGDAGYFDEEGYLYIHDRVKDMIVSGGENVYPAEVENALFSHPAVADAAVIGVPDEKWGEAVKGIVVFKPGQAVSAEELIAHCRERIAGFKTPKSIDVVEVLPRNPSGKVLRRELRKPYWEGRERMVG